MPDLSLTKILIRNWMTCRDVTLDFPSHGLIWVSGVVGAGKTALGEAICRTLIGAGSRFSRLSESSTSEKGNLYVKLDCELKGRPLSVELGHRCAELSKTGEGLRFTYDGRRVERGHIDETRQELTQAIRVSPKLARWAVFIDGDKLDFHELPEKEAVELLMESLSQPPWTQWHENAKRTSASFDVALSHAESEHHNATRQQSQATTGLAAAKKDLEQANADYAAAVASQRPEIERKKARLALAVERLAKAKAGISEIKDLIKQIENESATRYHELEIQRQVLIDERAAGKPARKQAADNHSQAVAEKRRLDRELKEMLDVPTSCPKCGRPWDQGHSEQEIAIARQAVEQANVIVETLAAEKSQLESLASAIDEKMENIDRQSGGLRNTVRSKIDVLSRSSEDLEDECDALNSEANGLRSRLAELEIGPSTAGIQRAEAVLEERKTTLEKTTKAVATASTAIVEAKEAVKVVRYWVKAFGPTGVPNMVLKDSIAPLNDTSRRISSTLTGSSLNVTYNTAKETAAGQERAKLVISVEHRKGQAIRAGNVRGSSKGQAGITNLIVAETLSSVGNVSSRIGFRWYDEVLNSQDPLVRRSTLAYLKNLAHRQRILIFVVDHHPEPASYADKVLLVEIDNDEVSTMKWA